MHLITYLITYFILVPSYPTKDAIDVIETELGVKVDEVFLDLDVNTK